MFILDLSKVLTYELHYDYVKKKYGNNERLLFSDTDSLTYVIKTEYVYKDFGKILKCLILEKNLLRLNMIFQTN